MKLYSVIPYSHRQQYAMKKQEPLTGIQHGTGWADALSKLGSVAGKIASNPAVQNLASAGLEMGTTVAGHAIANKLAQSSPAISNAVSSALEKREIVKQLYKAGEVSKDDALRMMKQIREESQSGGVKALKSIAKQQHGKGHVMSIRPVNHVQSRDPISVNRSGGLQTGGFAPLIPLALGSAGIGLLGSLLNPIIEKVSSKYIANHIN